MSPSQAPQTTTPAAPQYIEPPEPQIMVSTQVEGDVVTIRARIASAMPNPRDLLRAHLLHTLEQWKATAPEWAALAPAQTMLADTQAALQSARAELEMAQAAWRRQLEDCADPTAHEDLYARAKSHVAILEERETVLKNVVEARRQIAQSAWHTRMTEAIAERKRLCDERGGEAGKALLCVSPRAIGMLAQEIGVKLLIELGGARHHDLLPRL